jgi:signal transduction histidine kinase/ActR/RegA family two-component response regulator
MQNLPNRLRALLDPPVYPDREKTRKARLLHIFALGLLAISIAFLPIAPGEGLGAVIAAVVALALSAFVYWTIHHDHINIGGILLFGGMTLVILSSAAASIEDSPTNLIRIEMFLVLPILAAGMLVGRRVGLTFATIGVIAAFLFRSGSADTQLMDTVNIALLYYSTAGLTALFATSLHRAIGVAYSTSDELAALNRTLEERVSQRTRELSLVNAQLEEATRLKSEFMTRMSHELRTPLNSILGFSDVMMQGIYGPMSEKQLGGVERIHRNGAHLLALINDILDIAKIEAGRMELECTPFDPRELMKQVIEDNRSLADKRGLTLTAECDDKVYDRLLGDPTRLKQILVNFVSNGLKFTEKGGVTIRLKLIDPYTWSLEVTDSGIGMPPEALQKLFTEFYQVDSAPSRLRQQGTGVGLTVNRLLVDAMGGTITVHSEVGVGTTFTTFLPVRLPVEVLLALPAMNRQKMIVIFEDDDEVVTLMRDFLEGMDLQVYPTREHDQVLKIIDQIHPLAVFADLMIGNDARGWQVLEAIRGNKEASRVPVVVLSVLDERQRALRAGAVSYLNKPITQKDLLRVLGDIGVPLTTQAATTRVSS